MHKVSPLKFGLDFGSRTTKEKLASTEIQCCLGDSEICLNFWKQIVLLKNWTEPILVTIFLSELISDLAVSLVFSNFGDVVSVFKGRYEFNMKIRNDKRHVKTFPTGGDPSILPRKVSFHGGI